jgi:predicted DNA binding CopG/RHH family protein
VERIKVKNYGTEIDKIVGGCPAGRYYFIRRIQKTSRRRKMSTQGEEKALRTDTQVLTIRLPEELIEKIKNFCAHNDISVEQFALDALSEKLSRWKE